LCIYDDFNQGVGHQLIRTYFTDNEVEAIEAAHLEMQY
jgi:hypothetical protein